MPHQKILSKEAIIDNFKIANPALGLKLLPSAYSLYIY